MTPNGKELTYLSEDTISEAFHIPKFNNIIYKSKDVIKVVYDEDLDKCQENINKCWLLKSRPCQSNFLASSIGLTSRKSLEI